MGDVPEQETAGAKLARLGTDAQLWAREFIKLAPPLDEGTMIAWFASAIETGRSAGQAATPDGPHELVSRLSKRIADLRGEAGEEFCNCESYDKCYGECCGIGNCTCTTDATPAGPHPIQVAADAHRLTLRLGNWCCSCGWDAGTTDGREAMAEHAAHVHEVAGLTDATPAADGQDGDGS